jgi:hypothetical protein
MKKQRPTFPDTDYVDLDRERKEWNYLWARLFCVTFIVWFFGSYLLGRLL